MTKKEESRGRTAGRFTAWDLKPPAPKILDLAVLSVFRALEHGNLEPLASAIEAGKLPYLMRFMTPDDNARLARALRTGSPLTQSEKRKTRKAEQKRDYEIITRVCYWKAKGLPLYSHSATDTAIHRAADDYAAAPIPGAPARTPESIRKHVWAPMQAEAKPLPYAVADLAATLFIQGLKESDSNKQENTARFIWFGEHILANNYVLPAIQAETLSELDNLIDLTGHDCNHYRGLITRKVKPDRTNLPGHSTSGRK